jgi:hypothetical protein
MAIVNWFGIHELKLYNCCYIYDFEVVISIVLLTALQEMYFNGDDIIKQADKAN